MSNRVRNAPIADVAAWAAVTLRVPPGHLGGGPLVLPPYLRRFVRDCSRPAAETLLSTGRKNAKTTAVAVVLLAGLGGPLGRPGWRALVASSSAAKAIEVRLKVAALAQASRLTVVQRRYPEPGSLSLDGKWIEFAAGTSAAGHAADVDLSVLDEAGLLGDRDRGLFAGLRSALGARNGSLIVTGTRLGGWAVQDVERRHADPGVYVHSYSADPDSDTGDRRQWWRANPGLRSGIKSRDYLDREWRRAEADESAARSFRAHELNLAEHPDRELLLSASDWRKCVDGPLPERRGRVAIGLDVGGGTQLSAVSAYWPASRRLEVYAGAAGSPDERERRDGRPWAAMASRGELWAMGRGVMPLAEFLGRVYVALRGCPVLVVAADRHRRPELDGALQDAGVPWSPVWRDGPANAHDVAQFRRLALDGGVRAVESVLTAVSLEDAVLHSGPYGETLSRESGAGRAGAVTQPAQSMVRAVGAAVEHGRRAPRRAPRLHVVGQ